MDIVLAYDGTDFDSDISTLTVTVAADQLALNSALTTGNLAIAATVETAATGVTTTSPATAITAVSAVVAGNVTADGGETVTEKGIAYGTSANPTALKVPNGTGTGAISATLTGLEPNTLYYARAYATNSVGTTYGVDITFTTLARTVTGTPDLTMTEENLDGRKITLTVSGDTFTGVNGALDESKFTLNNKPAGLSVASAVRTSDTKVDIVLAYDGTDFDSDISTLTVTVAADRLAVNSALTTGSLAITATVETAATGVTTTSPATAITAVSAVVAGNVTADGGETVTEKGIAYGTSANPTALKVPNGTGTGAISATLTGLEPNTLYYARAYATNSVGTTYGVDITFTTLARTVTGTPDLTMTEENLDGRKITLTVSGDTFTGVNGALDESKFTLNNKPAGLTVASATRTSDKTVDILLAYDGTDFDANVTNLTVTVAADRLAVNSALTTGNLTISATVETAPGAPSVGTAIAGDGQATVSFTAPTVTGGEAITGYAVTSSPDGIVGTGTGSPITVTGLTNGTAYTFTVTATNSVGKGSSSGISNSVTPLSSSAGLKSITSQTDISTSGTGVDASNPITWELSVDSSKSTLSLSDITAVAGATVKLYSDSEFTSEITGSNTLSLKAGITTAYIKVTAQNGTTVKYYAIAISRVEKLNTPVGLTWDSIVKGRATWGAVNNRSSYTVQLYKNGSERGSAINGITNTYYDFSSVMTEAGTYTFKITATGNGTTYSDSDSSTISPALGAYTTTFKKNYDISDTAIYGTPQIVISGNKVTTPVQPVRNGYIFGGWYKENTCTTAWNFKTDSVSSDTNLYAKWTPEPVPTYSVMYFANGATSGSVPVDSNSYTIGTTAKVKGNTGSLANAGYTFSGWNSNGTTYKADQTFAITGNVNLTAIWTAVPATYTVTYNNNYTGGGTHASHAGIASGSTVTEPAVPSRTGYSFIGWYKDTACANPWKFNTDTITSNTIIYAKWAENTYTISGTVNDDAATPTAVSGATVKVVQGTVQFGTTVTTDNNGDFTVTGVPDGIYNLIVLKDGQEVTVCITVSGGNYTYTGSITLPSGNKNSKLDVIGSGTPNVVVDNLNNVFNDTTVYGSTEQNTVTSGGTVEIKLTVQKNDYSENKATVEAAMSSGGYTSGSILDVDLTKTSTSSNGASEESSITETNSLIKIIIPLPAELQGKASYVIYRAHDYGSGDVADAITTSVNTNGEYIVVSSDKTQITAYLKYFSTYAIAYISSNTTPSTDSTATSYDIKTVASTGGSINPGGNVYVTAGQGKTFTIAADQGYKISDVLVDGKSVGAVTSYTFSNVSTAHTIEVIYLKAADLPYYIDDKGNNVFIGFASDVSSVMKYIAPQGKTVLFKENPRSFTDISGHWAKPNIDFIAQRELYLGTSGDTFSPEAGMTRAMFATVIGRLYERSYGKLATTGIGSKFSDADYTAYYGNYVDWAAENNIITGVGNGKFEPDRVVTREEMAVMLYRFAELLKVSTSASGAAHLSYPDASAISSWAADAAKYCQYTGIISGRDGGKFVPQGTTTRAEVAVILQRFIEIIVK